jgi:hypothetical protein
MDVAFVDDHVSMTDWPSWAEAGEARRATLGDDGGASCAAAMGFLPLAINTSANKPKKIAVRSERKRIVPHSLFTGASHEAAGAKCPAAPRIAWQ